ncbi:MAG: tRNA pseudouridine(55) synthase TruB [Dehalococcoidia bacterium]|nr:tRNA pseudouridine(55) synthase TruB [Dehalococcoidia bacterium]
MSELATPERAEHGPVRGFLNIAKPSGMTSFDVVRDVRRALNVKRVGHAGTLDPLASGVLPIAFGEATRFIEGLVDARKAYRTTIALGVETTTYDSEGGRIASADASHLEASAVESALGGYLGEIEQTPPAFSAIKRGGVPAYESARAGEVVVLEPRRVTAYALEVTAFRGGPTAEVDVEIECSKGFYVRSLAHDLGAALGVGGHVTALSRTAVGPFRLADATPLDRAVALIEAGAWDLIAYAPDTAHLETDALIVAREAVADLRRGQGIRPAPRAIRRVHAPGIRARTYGIDGRFVGLVEATMTPGQWKPYRLLAYRATATP